MEETSIDQIIKWVSIVTKDRCTEVTHTLAV